MKPSIFLLTAGLMLNLAGTESNLVSDPGRTAAVERKPIQVMDRDYWYLLRTIWHELDGVKDETFVKEAGTHYVKWGISWKNRRPPRVMYLRNLKVYGAEGSRTRAVDFTLAVEKVEPDTKIYHPEFLSDNDPSTVCAVSGSIASAAKRYTPVKASLYLRFESRISIRRIILNYGAGTCREIGKVAFFCNGKEIPAQSLRMEKGTLTAIFKNLPPSNRITILCSSANPTAVLKDFPQDMQERLLARPFDSHLMRPVPFGLSCENFDRKPSEKILKKYDRSHIGIEFAEWDSQAFFQALNPKGRLYPETVGFFGNPPSDRNAFVRYMQNFWNWHREIFFNRIWGLSGGTALAHYGMEWGGKVAGLELTNHTSTIPHRTLMRYTAGAGRQYGRPWHLYLAYYLGKLAPDSRRPMPPNDLNWGVGPNAGISPSFARRVFLSGYFMGCTYQSFESEPWGQAEKKNGTVVLNANGKVLKEFYEWTHSPAGKRGDWYTPILLTADYRHGMIRGDGKVWSKWGSPEIEQTRGDRMATHFNRAIDYYDGQLKAWDIPPYSHNMHNSPLGDIFDTQLGNPPSGILPRFELYAVVILQDAIRINPDLKAKLSEYVSGGGTLVINAVHQSSLPPEMMTAEVLAEKTADSGLKIPRVKLNSAREAFRTDAGNVLAVSQNYGKGKVIMTLPEYFTGNDPEQPNLYVGRLLEALQREVLPFQVKGDCQFIISRLGADRWKLALINNKGVLKKPLDQQEKFDPRYEARIELRTNGPAEVESVYRKRELEKIPSGFRLTLPPGEVTVLEIRGIGMKPALTGPIRVAVKDRQAGRKPAEFHPAQPAPASENRPPRTNEGSSLLGEWKLDGTPGKVKRGRLKEQSFEIRHAALPSGRKVYDASAPGTAVSIRYNPGFPLNAGTFEFWAAPDFKAKLSDRGGYPLAGRFFRIVFCKGRWSFNALDSVTMQGPAAKPGQWDHLAFTWDGSECRFYVNGQEYTDHGVPIKIFLPIWNDMFDIGTLGRGRRTFGGKISAVKLYSGALPPEEIRKLYLQSKNEYRGE